MANSLSKRPCTLGTLNSRVENHGEEEVPAIDITVDGLMLDLEELGELLGGMDDAKALFRRGKLAEPILPQLQPYHLAHRFEKSVATLYVGPDNEAVKFVNCKLRRITLDPKTGGLTVMSVQVQATPEASQVATLFVHMNRAAHCSLRFGKLEEKRKAQPELPLGPGNEDEELGHDGEPLKRDEVPGPLDARE